jgi:hypothetical protein
VGEDDADTLTQLWMTFTKPRLSAFSKKAGSNISQNDTKAMIIDGLVKLKVLLPVPKRSRDDDDDDDEKKSKRPRGVSFSEDGEIIKSLLDENKSLEPVPETESTGTFFSKSESASLTAKMMMKMKRWGHFLKKDIATICVAILTKCFFVLSLLWERDPFEDQSVKLAGGLTFNQKAKWSWTTPLQWAIALRRMFTLVTIVWPDQNEAAATYYDVFMGMIHSARYPFRRVVEYERRLRLKIIGSDDGDSWPTTDLQLMSAFLLAAQSNSDQSSSNDNVSGVKHSKGSKTAICFRWRDRKCKQGDKCRFRHSCDACGPGVTVHDKNTCPQGSKSQSGT